MDARNRNNMQTTPLQQPFKFQTQRHPNPLVDYKPPPYQPHPAYHPQQQSQPSYQQLPEQQVRHLQHNNNPDVRPILQHQQLSQQHHNVAVSGNKSQLLLAGPAKPVVHPIRHDFWARRTAQRASEALRAANNMALPPLPSNISSPHDSGAHSQGAGGPHDPHGMILGSSPHVITSSLSLGSQGGNAGPYRSSTPPGRTSDDAAGREKRRRKRRAVSDSDRDSGRRSGGRGSGGEGRSGRTSGRNSRGGEGSPPEKDIRDSLPTNFRAAIAEFAPPLPPALLRKLEIKEVNGLGKIRVVLRVSPLVRLLEHEAAVLALDKKRRQVTLADPLAQPAQNSRLGVAAPKMFAFDQVYSQDDPQSDVVSGAAVDVLHAVLAGNDGCILCFGGALLGKSYTMVGLHGSQDQLGVIPSSVAWLYKSIAEQKVKSGARFSVRVSAVAIDATGANVKDLLEQYSQDGSHSPGLPRDYPSSGAGGVLSSLCELRAPSPETAAHFLDVALAGRSTLALSSVLQRQQQQSQGPIFPGSATLVYTLHVYQYAVDKNGKGGVVGGRSRLHLIDMGDLSARHGNSSMSLSSLTSVLLAIFNGQKYLPHRDNQLTGVLREALQSLTCHTALVVHVSPAARHAQHSLTTLQLAARVHRTRRKKIRGMANGSSSGSSGSRRSSGGDTSAGSSSLDFSSSDQSCDTVIYIGGGGPGDSTDGEHPPIFLRHHIRQPRPPPGLQRLRSLEQLRAHSASPTPHGRRPASASPTPTSRSVPNGKPFQKRKPCPPPRTVSHNTLSATNNNSRSCSNSPRTMPLQAGFIRHQPGVSQIIYPNNGQPLTQQPFMSTFKPFANLSASRHNNNNTSSQHSSQEDNLNMVNGNQLSLVSLGSTDKLHNYNAYQEPNDLVPTALSPNQNLSNVQNLRYYQLTQQQLHQQQLFQQHSRQEQQRALEQKQIVVCQQPQSQSLPLPQQTTAARHQPESKTAKVNAQSDEQWIDGPRVHKSRVSVARSNIKNEQQDETWVDGPQVSTQSNGTQASAATSSGQPGAYGFMDDHKKTMIEKWVEVQTAQVVNQITGKVCDKDKKPTGDPGSTPIATTTTGGLPHASNGELIENSKQDFNNGKDLISVTHMTQFRTCDESTNGSDVDTLSEDPSGSGAPPAEQPSLIEELERKNLIPSGSFEMMLECRMEEPCLDHILVSSADETNKVVSDCSTKGRGSPETTSLGGELSIDEVCSQCEALAEECEELSSLLSCEEEECKRQIHQGLATVLEEPELESAVAAEEAQMRASARILEDDLESECGPSRLDTLRSSRAAGRAGGEDGNEADEESSEFGGSRSVAVGQSPVTLTSGSPTNTGGLSGYRRKATEETKTDGYRKKCVKRACSSSSTSDRDFVGARRDSNRPSLMSLSSVRTAPEMIEVDLPAYPVVSVDCGTQVCEEDLLSGSASSGGCTSSSPSDDHPLRVLSEENLTCASILTDSYSQMGETGDEDDSDPDDGRPFSLFEVTDYAKLGQDVTLSSCGDSASHLGSRNLRELARMHALYRTLAGQGQQCPGDQQPRLQPSSLGEILSDSRDSLLEENKQEVEYANICSDVTSTGPRIDDPCQTCERCLKLRYLQQEGLISGRIPGQRFPSESLRWLSNGQFNTSLPNEKCTCDIQTDLIPYIPSSLYMFPNVSQSEQNSQSSLFKNRSETSINVSDYNTLETKDPDSSVDSAINDRVPTNGVPVPDFIEDLDANVILCNPKPYSNYSLEKNSRDTSEDRSGACLSDNDSDCVSNISEDSEYMIRTSKLSKFLCVGVGRTKTKTPYKVAKQNFKNESKKNSKMKECGVSSKVKSTLNKENSKSSDLGSKNLLKSPSRALSQNLSKSSSSSSSGIGSCAWKGDAASSSSGGLKGGRWGSKSQSSKGPSYTSCSGFETNTSFTYQVAPIEGYDSGHESGITQGSNTPQEVPEATPTTTWNLPLEKKTSKTDPTRLQSQTSVAVSSKSGTNSSLGTTPSLGESSGYGSMARDSECSSFSSSQESEMDEEQRREHQRCRANARLPAVLVEKFTEEDIQRYEGRSRAAECLQLQKEQKEHQEIAVLKERQKQLKAELAEAKKNLCVPDQSWSYELHVAGSEGVGLDTASLVLALARETEILHKRVLAARGRVLCATAFLPHDKRHLGPTAATGSAGVGGPRSPLHKQLCDVNAKAPRSVAAECIREDIHLNSSNFSSSLKPESILDLGEVNKYVRSVNEHQSRLKSEKTVCDITHTQLEKKYCPTDHRFGSVSDDLTGTQTHESQNLNHQSNKLCSEIVSYFNTAALQSDTVVI